MDDEVAEATMQALEDLTLEMERRGKVLSAQPGKPPKTSRKLADRRQLGLHPLVMVDGSANARRVCARSAAATRVPAVQPIVWQLVA